MNTALESRAVCLYVSPSSVSKRRRSPGGEIVPSAVPLTAALSTHTHTPHITDSSSPCVGIARSQSLSHSQAALAMTALCS